MSKLNKFEQILLVKRLGLNTEDSVLVKSIDDFSWLWEFVDNEPAISLRTMHPSDNHVKTPHYPFVLKQDAERRIREVLDLGFYGIVARPIDPKDTLFAGAALIEDSFKICLELANGPCTVRRVTHEGFIDYRINYPEQIPERREMREMIAELKKVPFRACVVELSYYRIPVGYKHEHVIIWGIEQENNNFGGD